AFCCGVPGESFGVVVVRVDVVHDGVLEFVHAGEDAAADALGGDLGKPALDEVEPGSAGGGEVHVEAGMLGKPRPDLGVLVGGVVVGDDVQVQVLGRF